MEQFNKVFFYQGEHNNGLEFMYDSEKESLNVVNTTFVNFDNDAEGLHLKKHDAPVTVESMFVSIEEAKNNLNYYLGMMLDSRENELNNFLKLS